MKQHYKTLQKKIENAFIRYKSDMSEIAGNPTIHETAGIVAELHNSIDIAWCDLKKDCERSVCDKNAWFTNHLA